MKTLRFLGLWGPFLLSIAGSFWLSSQTKLPLPPGTSDKLLHIVGYAGIAFTAVRAFHGGLQRLLPRPTGRASLVVAVYGALDEIHQAFVPGRNCSFADLVADVVGIALAVAILAAVLGFGAERVSREDEAPTL